MDAKLVGVIESLPPEMKAILDHDQNFTGFNIESILLQSFFFHYPIMFMRLEMSIEFFILLDNNTRSVLQKLARKKRISEDAFISKILKLNNQKYIKKEFPSFEILIKELSKYQKYNGMDDFEKVKVFIQQLILSFHMAIQPSYLVSKALRNDQSCHFSSLMISLNADNVKKVLGKISFSTYNVRRIEFYISKMIKQINEIYNW